MRSLVLADFRREAEGFSGDWEGRWLRCRCVTSFPRWQASWILTLRLFLWGCIFLSLKCVWRVSSNAGSKESWRSISDPKPLPPHHAGQHKVWNEKGLWYPHPNSQYLHSSKCLIRVVHRTGPLKHTHRAHVLHCKVRIFNIDLSKSYRLHWFSQDWVDGLW